MQIHRCTYAKCLEQSQWNDIKLSQHASHSHCIHPLCGKAFRADKLKSRDTLDSHEVRWIGGFSPQKGDAYISTHNTANYFCTSGSFSAANKSWNLKKKKSRSNLSVWGKNTEEAWGNFSKPLRSLTRGENEKEERSNCFQTMHHCYVYFLGVPNKVTYIQPKIMSYPWLCSLKRETKTTYMEVTLRHQLQRFFVSCFPSAEQWREKSNH